MSSYSWMNEQTDCKVNRISYYFTFTFISGGPCHPSATQTVFWGLIFFFLLSFLFTYGKDKYFCICIINRTFLIIQQKSRVIKIWCLNQSFRVRLPFMWSKIWEHLRHNPWALRVVRGGDPILRQWPFHVVRNNSRESWVIYRVLFRVQECQELQTEM